MFFFINLKFDDDESFPHFHTKKKTYILITSILCIKTTWSWFFKSVNCLIRKLLSLLKNNVLSCVFSSLTSWSREDYYHLKLKNLISFFFIERKLSCKLFLCQYLHLRLFPFHSASNCTVQEQSSCCMYLCNCETTDICAYYNTRKPF